jgi:UV DNA damage endonuclease
MGVGREGVLVVHPVHGHGAQAALARVARRVERLDATVRRRLVIENGDRAADLPACLWLHRRTGLPVVLDVLHHRCHNPSGLPLEDALAAALATWPVGQPPKVHLSSPRTELRLLRRGGQVHVSAPLPTQHSDFVNPFECIELLRSAARLGLRPFDFMLEAKAHDLAVLRLREQIAAYASDIAAGVQ